MQWTDDGIVLGVKRHGEASGVLELMTKAHGRHCGLVRGAFGARMKPILQIGNGVSATWRARLDEHLGNFGIEPQHLRAAGFFAQPHAVYGITHLATLMRLLPERDPHPALYAALEDIVDHLSDPVMAAPMVVCFELQLLSDLGFGLDLDSCAATGTRDDLSHVSPKSGRAVSRAAGEPWADRLLRLPAFLREPSAPRTASDVADGFALTGFFLERHVLAPRGLDPSPARAQFIAALARALPRVA